MKTPAYARLVSLAFALPVAAQSTVATKAIGNTEKLWKIEATGISG